MAKQTQPDRPFNIYRERIFRTTFRKSGWTWVWFSPHYLDLVRSFRRTCLVLKRTLRPDILRPPSCSFHACRHRASSNSLAHHPLAPAACRVGASQSQVINEPTAILHLDRVQQTITVGRYDGGSLIAAPLEHQCACPEQNCDRIRLYPTSRSLNFIFTVSSDILNENVLLRCGSGEA